jgi:DNA-binding transcriptional regulator YiaG
MMKAVICPANALETLAMTTLAVALKDEIRRLARKEIRAQTGATAKAVAQYRRDIAKLKRQLREQDRKIANLSRRQPQHEGAEPADENGNVRFSARSAKAQRRRTGLSAADYAKLVGVSPITIYNWENGKSRPRKEQFASLVALRGVGKRAAQAQLDSLAASKKSARKTGPPARGKIK